MKDGDSRGPSGLIFPLQAHGSAFTFQDGKVAGRASVLAYRAKDYDDFGIPIQDPSCIGDMSGFFVWKSATQSRESTDTSESGTRAIPTWREVMPVITTEPTVTPGGPDGEGGGPSNPGENAKTILPIDASPPGPAGEIPENTRITFDTPPPPKTPGSPGSGGTTKSVKAGTTNPTIPTGGQTGNGPIVWVYVNNPHPYFPVQIPPPPPANPPGYTFTGKIVPHYTGGSGNYKLIIDYWQYEFAKNAPSGPPGGGGGPGGGGPGSGTGNPDSPGSDGEGPTFACRPTRNFTYDADNRMATLALDLIKNVGYWPKFPIGHFGVVVETMNEDKQVLQFMPTDPRLPAPNHEGGGACGALVCDLKSDSRYDPERMAHLQSAFRVLKKPVVTIGINATGGNAQGSGNALALQFGVSGRGDSPGGFVHEALRGVSAKWSVQDGGAMHTGFVADKHRIGIDADQIPVNGMHLGSDANFVMDFSHDGPLDFEIRWPTPRDDLYPYFKRVHMGWNPKGTYNWPGPFGKPFVGNWGWWTGEILEVITPSIPPPNPSRGPSTPGGEDPGGPPTPGGEPPTGPTTPGGVNLTISLDYAAAPKTIQPRASESIAAWRRNAAMLHELASPGFLARPQRYVKNTPDTRYQDGITEEAVAEVDARTPVTGRLSAWGAQGGKVGGPYLTNPGGGTQTGGEPWVYTQKPGRSRHKAGTAPGGWIITPPEVDLSDTDADFAPAGLTLSTTYFALAPGARLGFGLPELASGGMKTAISLAGNAGTLEFRYHSSTGATSDLATLTGSTFKLTGLMTFQLQGATSGTLGIKAAGVTTDHTLTMPAATGIGSLRNDGAGALAWVDGEAWTYQSKIAAYGAAIGEFVNGNATSGAFSVTLPTAVGNAGRGVTVRKSDASANAVTVDTTSGQTINGAATLVLTTQYDCYEFLSDGANWMVS